MRSNKIKRMNDKPSFFMVKIDADNNLKKDELLGKQENKFLVYPKLSKQINEKEVLIYAEKGRKYSHLAYISQPVISDKHFILIIGVFLNKSKNVLSSELDSKAIFKPFIV